jgi:hypothetical protein
MLCLLEVKRKTKVLTFDNKTLVNIISKKGYHFYTPSRGVNSNVRGGAEKQFFSLQWCSCAQLELLCCLKSLESFLTKNGRMGNEKFCSGVFS